MLCGAIWLCLDPQTVDDYGPGMAPIVVELVDLCVVLAAEESHGPAVLDDGGSQAGLGHAAYVPGSLEGIPTALRTGLYALAGHGGGTTLSDGAAVLPLCL